MRSNIFTKYFTSERIDYYAIVMLFKKPFLQSKILSFPHHLHKTFLTIKFQLKAVLFIVEV